MLNKLKTTTALVGALTVVAAPAAFAETKIGGNLEQTYSTFSKGKAAEQVDGRRAIGSEANISLSGSKETDNGLSVKYGFIYEDDADTTGKVDTLYTTIGSGNFSVTIGEDTGLNLQSSAIPYISDNFETMGGSINVGLSFNNHAESNVHEQAHIGFDYKSDVGTFTYRYAPDSSTSTGRKVGDSVVANDAAKEGSSQELLFTGNLGVEGLKAIVGRSEETQKSSTDSGNDGQYDVVSLSYNFGAFTIGAEQRDQEVIGGTGTTDEKARIFGASFAATDKISIGVYDLNFEKEGQTSDEEGQMIQVGYNLGGLGFEVSYAQFDNLGFDSTSDGDSFQIRTVQKF